MNLDLDARYLTPLSPSDADVVGIALSGGGVRAACLSLGALQVAEERGLLDRSHYVTAVSGGAYIATSYLAARGLDEHPDATVAGRARTAWSRGSLEEEHLKRNLRYLVEGILDLLMAVASYGRGLVLNLLPFCAAMVAFSIGTGLTFCRLGFLERGSAGLVAHGTVPRVLISISLMAVAPLVASLVARMPPKWTERSRYLPSVLLLTAFALVLPDVVDLVATARPRLAGPLTSKIGLTVAPALLTLVAVVRTQWTAASRARLLMRSAVRFAFGLSCVAALLIPFASAIGVTVETSHQLRAAAIALAAALIVLLCGLFLHANQTSLHRLYAHRLNRAYVVANTEKKANAKKFIRLDERGLADLPVQPELVICAAVNLRECESAHGEASASFVFTPTIVGSPALPSFMPTDEFCEAIADRRVQLSSLIAASGAAVAPNMGRFTRKTYRFALVLFNMRLGMWVQNAFEARKSARQQRAPARNRITAALRRGWDEPGPLGTIREALGLLSVHHRFLFISDGGHWDNSGIVELLRRHCSTIFAVDAANDSDRSSNILRAISLARAELGVDFDADASFLESREPVVRLGFRYPEDGRGTWPRHLILMRTFISPDMPADLVALARSQPAFPRHSTFNQFFSARDSDGYVALGRWLADRGIDRADLPPTIDLTGRDGPQDRKADVGLSIVSGSAPAPAS